MDTSWHSMSGYFYKPSWLQGAGLAAQKKLHPGRRGAQGARQTGTAVYFAPESLSLWRGGGEAASRQLSLPPPRPRREIAWGVLSRPQETMKKCAHKGVLSI